MKPHAPRIPGVRDSKTLSMGQRERLDPLIRRRAVAIGVGAASVREIDTINIYHATHLAMRRAVARLGEHDHVLVDGNRIRGFEAAVGPYTAIVDGDAQVLHDRVRLDRGQGRPGPDDDPPRGSLPGLRLGAQPGLRDPGASRRHPAPRPHAVPSPQLPRPPANARRRPDQPRSLRRSPVRRDVRQRSWARSCSRRPRRAAAAIAEAEAIVRDLADPARSAAAAASPEADGTRVRAGADARDPQLIRG